jgi:hypothetical protein
MPWRLIFERRTTRHDMLSHSKRALAVTFGGFRIGNTSETVAFC